MVLECATKTSPCVSRADFVNSEGNYAAMTLGPICYKLLTELSICFIILS